MDLSRNGATTTNLIKLKDDQFHNLKGLFAAIENALQTTIAEITGALFWRCRPGHGMRYSPSLPNRGFHADRNKIRPCASY